MTSTAVPSEDIYLIRSESFFASSELSVKSHGESIIKSSGLPTMAAAIMSLARSVSPNFPVRTQNRLPPLSIFSKPASLAACSAAASGDTVDAESEVSESEVSRQIRLLHFFSFATRRRFSYAVSSG